MENTIENLANKYLQVKEAALEILDELPYSIIIVDEDGIIQFVNRKFVKLFEWPKGGVNGILGKKLEDTVIPANFKDTHANKRKEFNKDSNPRPMRGVEGQTRTGKKLNIDVAINDVQTDAGKLSFALIREKEDLSNIGTS